MDYRSVRFTTQTRNWKKTEVRESPKITIHCQSADPLPTKEFHIFQQVEYQRLR